METPAAAALRFGARALAWSLVLFSLMRLPWIEERLIQGLIDAQQRIAEWYGARANGLVISTRAAAVRT